jgi:hypothetical protein
LHTVVAAQSLLVGLYDELVPGFFLVGDVAKFGDFFKKSLATDKNEGSLVAKSCSQAKFFPA